MNVKEVGMIKKLKKSESSAHFLDIHRAVESSCTLVQSASPRSHHNFTSSKGISAIRILRTSMSTGSWLLFTFEAD